MVQHTARDVSDFLDPIWERQKDTGREQKDGTDERVAGGGLQYLSLCRGRSEGRWYMYHTLIIPTGAEARNDMRKWPPRPPTRAPAGHRMNEGQTSTGTRYDSCFLFPWRNSEFKSRGRERWLFASYQSM